MKSPVMGPRRPEADLAAVDFADGDDFGAGAGGEDFVGDEEIVAGEVGFADFAAQGGGEFEHEAAGDAAKGAVGDVGG